MGKFFNKKTAYAIMAAAMILSLSGGAAAAVKATSLLTVAKLVKNGDAYSIVHSSGFSFLLPSEENLSIYEAKDAYGLRKLFVSSSMGPVLEISTMELDSLIPGPLDALARSLYDTGMTKPSSSIGISAAGVDGLRFVVQGKATAASGTVPVKVYTILTDYNRVLIIVAHASQTSLTAAENLVGKLIIGLQLDDSWERTTV